MKYVLNAEIKKSISKKTEKHLDVTNVNINGWGIGLGTEGDRTMSECTICKKPIGDSMTSFASPFRWTGKEGKKYIVHRDCVAHLIQEKELDK